MGNTVKQDLSDFLSRPIVIAKGEMSNTSGKYIKEIYLDKDLLRSQLMWRSKVQGFMGISATWVIRLQVNATPFHQGRLIMVYEPMAQHYKGPHRRFSLCTATQLPRAELDIATESQKVLRVPYVTLQSHHDMMNGSGAWGRVTIFEYLPFRTGSSSSSVDYTIWASLEDVDLAAPTVPYAVTAQSSTNWFKPGYNYGPILTHIAERLDRLGGQIGASPLYPELPTAQELDPKVVFADDPPHDNQATLAISADKAMTAMANMVKSYSDVVNVHNGGDFGPDYCRFIGRYGNIQAMDNFVQKEIGSMFTGYYETEFSVGGSEDSAWASITFEPGKFEDGNLVSSSGDTEKRKDMRREATHVYKVKADLYTDGPEVSARIGAGHPSDTFSIRRDVTIGPNRNTFEFEIPVEADVENTVSLPGLLGVIQEAAGWDITFDGPKPDISGVNTFYTIEVEDIPQAFKLYVGAVRWERVTSVGSSQGAIQDPIFDAIILPSYYAPDVSKDFGIILQNTGFLYDNALFVIAALGHAERLRDGPITSSMNWSFCVYSALLVARGLIKHIGSTAWQDDRCVNALRCGPCVPIQDGEEVRFPGWEGRVGNIDGVQQFVGQEGFNLDRYCVSTWNGTLGWVAVALQVLEAFIDKHLDTSLSLWEYEGTQCLTMNWTGSSWQSEDYHLNTTIPDMRDACHDGVERMLQWMLNATADSGLAYPIFIKDDEFPGYGGGLFGFPNSDPEFADLDGELKSGGQLILPWRSIEHNTNFVSVFDRHGMPEHRDRAKEFCQLMRHTGVLESDRLPPKVNYHFTGTGNETQNDHRAAPQINYGNLPMDTTMWDQLAQNDPSYWHLKALAFANWWGRQQPMAPQSLSKYSILSNEGWIEGSGQFATTLRSYGLDAWADALLTACRAHQLPGDQETIMWPFVIDRIVGYPDKMAGMFPASTGIMDTGFELPGGGAQWSYYPVAHLGASSWFVIAHSRINPYRYPEWDIKPMAEVSAQSNPATREATAQDGPITSMLAKASGVAHKLTGVPGLADFAGPTAWATSIASNVAGMFGWSKPLNTNPITRVNVTTNQYQSNIEGVDNAYNMGLLARNQVRVMPSFAGHGVDETTIDYIKKVPAFVTSFKITSTWDHARSLFDIPVSPWMMWQRTSFGSKEVPSGAYSATPLHFLSSLFKYWRGGIVFKFKFAKSPTHTGRMAISFTPCLNSEINGSEYIPSFSDSAFVHREVIDYTTLTEYTFHVPYVQFIPFLEASDSIGRLQGWVVNDMKHPEIASDTIDVAVEVYAADDFEVAVPQTPHFVPAQPGDQLVSAQSSSATVIKNDDMSLTFSELCIGEKIASLKQLALRACKIPPGVLSQPFSINHDEQYRADYYSIMASLYAYSRGGVVIRYLSDGQHELRMKVDGARLEDAPFVHETAQNMASVYVPQYLQTWGRLNSLFGDQDKRYSPHVHLSYHTTGEKSDFYRSAADDTQFGFFLGIPPLQSQPRDEIPIAFHKRS